MAVIAGREYRQALLQEEDRTHPVIDASEEEGISKRCDICLEKDLNGKVFRLGRKHNDLVCADCFKTMINQTRNQNIKCPFCREVVPIRDNTRKELGLPVRPSLLRRVVALVTGALFFAALVALGIMVSHYVLLGAAVFLMVVFGRAMLAMRAPNEGL